ncbi:MAG TPA: hypothetical protein VIS96_12900 [Terrimicrobiaceae bacterium]
MTRKTLTTTSASVCTPGERRESIGFEAAAVLASASPLGIITMGTFPLSLIALGRIRRQHFDDTFGLRPKRKPIDEELSS